MISFFCWLISPIGLLVAIFIISLSLGIPIAIAMGLASLASIFASGWDPQILAIVTYTATDNFALIAIPMFILAGNLMSEGGITRRITDFCDTIAGQYAGGVAGVAILGSVFFSALTGSGPAVTAAIGSIMIPAMKEAKYNEAYAGAVCACSGGIGIVIPPSIPLILYGLTSSTSIGKLFIAGVIPGLLLGVVLYSINYFVSKRESYRGTKRDRSLKSIYKSINDAKYSFGAPVIILGGIYAGIFSVTEASVIAVLYSWIVGSFIYKELNIKRILNSIKKTIQIAGTIFLVLSTATVFGRILTLNQVSQKMADAILNISTDPTVILLLIVILLLFIGMWMETIAQVMILTPIFLPIIKAAGIDPVFFGIIFVIACEIGFETPPLGANLYVATELVDASFEEMSLQSLKFALGEMSVLFFLVFFPKIVLFLPNLLIK